MEPFKIPNLNHKTGNQKMESVDIRKKRLEEQAANAQAELQAIAVEEAQAIAKKIEDDKVRRAELIAEAEEYETSSKEAGLSREDVKNRLTWAKQARADAAKIIIPGEEFLAAPDVEPIAKLSLIDEYRNTLMAVISVLLVGVFYGAMGLIKVEDPEAIVYDSSAYQKIFLVLSIFCILQLVKILAVRLFYPMIYKFKNNREMPDFDFSKYFKEELTPLQQICVSLFISSFFSLEFIMLLQVKF